MQELVIDCQESENSLLTTNRENFLSLISSYKSLGLVSDENTYQYARDFEQVLNISASCVLPPGEEQKRFSTLEFLCEKMATGLKRDGAILCVGGGVIGDLGGFLSAVFLRGVPFFLVPTSLLSMVDSSVGGKTAINLKAGKNLVGSFHSPRGIYLNPDYLKTLNRDHWISGLGEMYKHALLSGPDLLSPFFNQLRTWPFQELDSKIILDSIGVKKGIVEEDFKEKGRRAVLNLGHTFSHALESYESFARPHGIYVLYGLVLEAALGFLIHKTERSTLNNILQVVLSLLEPLSLPEYSKLEPFLLKDKKNREKAIHFVFLKEEGQVFKEGESFTTAMSPKSLREIMPQLESLLREERFLK